MSRNRRNRGEPSGDPLASFDNQPPPAPGVDLSDMSTSGFASAGYNSQVTGEFEGVGRGKVTAKPIDIDKIHPDPSQPRRTIPSRLRELYWKNGRSDAPSMAWLFEKWLEEIKIKKGGDDFDLEAILSGENTGRARIDEGQEGEPTEYDSATGHYEEALTRIADLAASIRRDGLTNPITVVPQGSNYVIETGERRWMAYQLLRWHTNGDPAWLKIPAREVENINIWRQASENNARADLSAIARARQLALLLMDIYAPNYDFAAFGDFAQEQDFYAQVAEGGEFKVPTEKREMILNAMGFRHPVQIRQYRALLRLPARVWTLADDYNWTENAIQKDLLQRSDGDENALVWLAEDKAGIPEDERVSVLTRDEDDAAVPELSARAMPGKIRKYAHWRKDLARLRADLDKMLIQDRDELLREIEDILHQFRKLD